MPIGLFRCKFCGTATTIDPSDQVMPGDYCHFDDHPQREKGDDDGVEYGDPRDHKEGRE